MAEAGVGGGLVIYDVTNPLRPQLLSRLSSGHGTHGVHELSAVQREDGRVLVVMSTPRTYEITNGRVGDVRIIDITNPERPDELADWDVRRDAPAAVRESAQRGRPFDELLAHSAWTFDGGSRVPAQAEIDGLAKLLTRSASSPRPDFFSRDARALRADVNSESGNLYNASISSMRC